MPLHIIKQDITKFQCDAIVNPTNANMNGDGGLDFAIHKAAGPELFDECQTLRPLETGFAKITLAYNLKCKYVIHTTGPIYRGGGYGERALLRSCYLECLRLAKLNKCKTVAFPLISSGTYRYPKDRVLSEAVNTISEFLQETEMNVYLCVVDTKKYQFNLKLEKDLQEYIDNSNKREICIDKTAVMPFQKAKTLNNDVAGKSLNEFVKNLSASFSDTLTAFIDKKGISDTECYKKANIDRKVFSKMKCNPAYRPSKVTAVAYCISLKLDLDEALELLSSAGHTLSRSNKFDSIIIYFILKKNYDINEINEALFHFEQPLLGVG